MVDRVLRSPDTETGQALGVTEWYARTDEDGSPVGCNYETGEHLEDGSGDGAPAARI